MLMRDKELTRKHQMELIRQRTQHRKVFESKYKLFFENFH